MELGRDTAITWLGHATIEIQTPGGKRLLLDPWLDGNPACPDDMRTRDACDILAVTQQGATGYALNRAQGSVVRVEIEEAMPADAARGDRYPEAQMGQLDSER